MKLVVMIFMAIFIPQVNAQVRLPVYEKKIPNSIDTAKAATTIPELFVYSPELTKKNNHVGILIIPGGGYSHVAIDHEGHAVAKELIKAGFTAFVLNYRLPSPRTMLDKSIGPLQDAQRAMQLIREQFPNLRKVGIIGFSAGGHLASTLITKATRPVINNDQGISLAPDFSALIYPVISMEEGITHRGSRINLLGEHSSAEKIIEFSADKNVTDKISPIFFVHAKDDKSVPIANSYLMIEALNKVGIKNEIVTYEQGGHGFGLINKTDSNRWLDHFFEWYERVVK